MIADSRAGGQLFGQRGGRRPLGQGGLGRQNEAGRLGTGSEWSGYAPERTQRAAAQICDQGEGKKKPAGCMGPAGSRRRAHRFDAGELSLPKSKKWFLTDRATSGSPVPASGCSKSSAFFVA